MKLNTENARVFNSSLKKAVSELTGQKVKVRIINPYKFPKCWVEVDGETEFTNEFRLAAFDAFGNNRAGLLNPDNVCYGNIRPHTVSGIVTEWEKLFENKQ